MIRTFLHRLRTLIVWIATPAHCYACKTLLSAHALLCNQCRSGITPVVSTTIEVTSTNKVTVHALSTYDDPLSTLIRAKNYHDYIASVYIGKLMAEYAGLAALECDYIVPVPLHWTRRMWRGFNQAEVIAHELAKVINKPVLCAVYRKKRTVFQATLSRFARAKNVESSFGVTSSADQLQDKKILIVDDLMTSGATIKALSKALLVVRPVRVIAFVAARVVQ